MYNSYSYENKQPGNVLINIISFTTTSNIHNSHTLSCYNGTVQLAECYILNIHTTTKLRFACQPNRYQRFKVFYSQAINTLLIHIINTADSLTMPGDVELSSLITKSN